MGWSPTHCAAWTVDNLAPTLNNAEYNPLYIAMDDQRFEIPWFTELMFEYPKTEELFSGTAVHWYTDEMFSPLRLSQLHDKYPDKFILMTEACTGKYN